MADSVVLERMRAKEPSPVSAPELDDILRIRGVGGAVLIRNDGSVMAAAGSPEPGTDGLPASSLRLVFESGMVADRIQAGPLFQIFLEFEDRVLMIQETDHNRFIAVVADPDANIGQISYHMNKGRRRQAT